MNKIKKTVARKFIKISYTSLAWKGDKLFYFQVNWLNIYLKYRFDINI